MSENVSINSNEKKNNKSILDAFDWLDSIVVAIIAVVFLFTFAFRIVGIKGPSMQNTLFEGDKVVISNLFYEPKCGDVVVISRNYTNDYSGQIQSDEPIIKRVIATEGMYVDIDFDAGIVYVDGVALQEDYIKTLTTRSFDMEFPLRVGENQMFVLGDNRAESMDSRDKRIGLVDTRYVLGKALFRVYRTADFREGPLDFIGVIK